MMGILGLEGAPFLSDRIFFLIDSDHDGYVRMRKMCVCVCVCVCVFMFM